MKARRLIKFALPVLVAVVFLAAGASSAFAGVATSTINVVANGHSFLLPSAIVPGNGSVIDTQSAVYSFVHNTVAPGVYVKMVNATRTLNKKKRKFIFTKPQTGYSISLANQTLAANAIVAAIPSALATTAVTTVDLNSFVTITKPKVSKLGKAIIVVLAQRKIWLYNNLSVEKTYRCAIGQPAWPTPTGSFWIGKKVKMPTWRNGYASWSRNMPAYIGPGPNNPLGTRAMYVYGSKGDTGVRFHGVPHSEDPSIGHAASHGCLRMHRKDVENFFPRVSVGTPVYIIK